jgi:hypothetical protein
MTLLLARVLVHRKGLRSDVAHFSRPERLALIIIGLLVPYPINVVIFLAAGTLSSISALQVLKASRRSDMKVGRVEPVVSPQNI